MVEDSQEEKNVFNGSRVLSDHEEWLIAPYVLVLGAIGLVFGFVWDSQIMIGLAGGLVGLYMAPWAPVWKKAQSAKDQKMLILSREGPGKFLRIWYWSLPGLIVLFLLLGAMAQVFG